MGPRETRVRGLLVDPHVAFVSEEQKLGTGQSGRVDVGAHMLSGMRSRAQVASSLAERISLPRNIALYSLAFFFHA